MRWSLSWTLIKDVALTGTGIFLILSQVFSRSPSDILLVTGLALTVPSVAGHATALMSGRGESPSSQPPSPPTQPPSSSSSGG